MFYSPHWFTCFTGYIAPGLGILSALEDNYVLGLYIRYMPTVWAVVPIGINTAQELKVRFVIIFRRAGTFFPSNCIGLPITADNYTSQKIGAVNGNAQPAVGLQYFLMGVAVVVSLPAHNNNRFRCHRLDKLGGIRGGAAMMAGLEQGRLWNTLSRISSLFSMCPHTKANVAASYPGTVEASLRAELVGQGMEIPNSPTQIRTMPARPSVNLISFAAMRAVVLKELGVGQRRIQNF